ncbi:MAG: sporulation integral membrane protein YtvI [Syntrophomonadaceae bacterium]|jgi:sporulation integral membrane protein YtvI|nr:sporulation integral membrane protein YtvI [Syntrophomonadaceae bacterium]
MDPELQKYVKFLVKIAILVLGIAAFFLTVTYIFPYLGVFFKKAPSVLLPFIIAVIMAFIIEPAVVFLENKVHIKRSLAAFISLLLFLGLLSLVLFFLFSRIGSELARISPMVATHSLDFSGIIINFINDLKVYFLALEISPELQAAFNDNWAAAVNFISAHINNMITGVFYFLTLLPNLMVVITIATIATFFMVKDKAMIKSFIWKNMPAGAQIKSNRVLHDVMDSLAGFVKAYIILVSITAIITMIALKIAGVQYALTIGMVTGVLDLLPILGPGLVFLPWIIWELILGSKSLGIGLLVIYVIISVVRQVLEPKITGDNIGLHPLATLLSMYIGLKLIGFIGIIAGPVLLVLAIAVKRAGFFDSFKWGNNKHE